MLVSKLVYATDEADFSRTDCEIKNMSQTFHDYLSCNWHPLKPWWVHYLKKSETNLGNSTTNRIESQFNNL